LGQQQQHQMVARRASARAHMLKLSDIEKSLLGTHARTAFFSLFFNQSSHFSLPRKQQSYPPRAHIIIIALMFICLESYTVKFV
jgi:hypothetical protein